MKTEWKPIKSKPKNVKRLINIRKNSLAFQDTRHGIEYFRKKDNAFFLNKDDKWFKLVRKEGI